MAKKASIEIAKNNDNNESHSNSGGSCLHATSVQLQGTAGTRPVAVSWSRIEHSEKVLE